MVMVPRLFRRAAQQTLSGAGSWQPKTKPHFPFLLQFVSSKIRCSGNFIALPLRGCSDQFMEGTSLSTSSLANSKIARPAQGNDLPYKYIATFNLITYPSSSKKAVPVSLICGFCGNPFHQEGYSPSSSFKTATSVYFSELRDLIKIWKIP